MGDIAPRDSNYITALLATSNVDASTVKIYGDPLTHRLLVDANFSGTTDNTTFTIGTSTGTPIMGVYTATVKSVSNGATGVVAINSVRSLMVDGKVAAVLNRNGQFRLLVKGVLTTPQTVSGNSTMAFDGVDTLYLYVPKATNSEMYSYVLSTGVATRINAALDEGYAGAAMIFVNQKLYFTRGGGYSAFDRLNTDGTGYTHLTGTANGTNFGCAMVWDGGDYIYLRNATPALERYSISAGTWSTMTAPGSSGAEGIALAMVGNNLIYSFQGGGTTGFSVYSITANTWTAKTAAPATVYDGGCLAWNGDNYLYAYRGIGAQDFWAYDISANTWSIMTKLPVPASTGSTFLAKSDGTFLSYIAEPSGITAFGKVNNLYIFDPDKFNTISGSIPVGGIYNSSQPSLSNTQHSELQLAADGALAVAQDTTTEAATDAVSNTIRAYKDIFGFIPNQKVLNWGFNGTSWDRVRTGTVSNVSGGTGITSSIIVGRYNTTPPTITAGNYNELQTDIAGNLKVVGTISSISNPVTITGTISSITNPVTITGTISSITNTVTVAAHALTAGTANIGSVSILNGAAGAAVNIQDGGNSITIDGSITLLASTAVIGTVNAVQSGGWVIGTLSNIVTGTIGTVNAVTTLTGGGVAHDNVDSGNPIKIGFKAETSPKGITVVADGDRTDAYADADGMQLTKLNTSGADFITERVAITNALGQNFSTFGAAANVFNYVTALSIHNSSGTTNYIDFQSGSNGAIIFTVAAPAGGGAVMAGAMPLFKTLAVNTTLYVKASTAQSTVYVSIAGYQSKV